MDTRKATVRGGRIDLEAPEELADGAEVLVAITPIRGEDAVGLAESEWRDDPAALADWGAWLRAIEPIDFGPEADRFDEEFRRLNVEAVRRAMEAGGPR